MPGKHFRPKGRFIPKMDLKKCTDKNGAVEVSNASNPSYSPIVPKRKQEEGENTMKPKEAEYVELGVINAGYDQIDEKAVTLPISQPRFQNNSESLFDDENYLTPKTVSQHGPVVRGRQQLASHYEDLDQMIAKVKGQTTNQLNSEKLPKKKSNTIYEPSSIKQKQVEKEDKIPYNTPCWIICALFIIGMLVVLSLILFALLSTGAMKLANCNCDETIPGNLFILSVIFESLPLQSFQISTLRFLV